jgi:hypothetical protein
MNTGLAYNTQLSTLTIPEYGRIVQELVKNICETEDREKRNRMARTVIQIMINLNPQLKEIDNYRQTLWDHLHIISDYKLDVDAPFHPPEKEQISKKPDPVPYKDTMIKFRFYGRNLQEMCEQAAEMEESVMKTAFINYIASFMVNSSRNWNDENLTPEVVSEHIRTLSKGKLVINPTELDIHIEHSFNKKPLINKNGKPGMIFKKKKKNNLRNRR